MSNHDYEAAISGWLSGKSPSARRNYVSSMRRFASWAMGVPNGEPSSALKLLCEAGPSAAHVMARRWRDSMIAEGSAEGTVAGRIAALSSSIRHCRGIGIVSWTFDEVAPSVTRNTRPVPTWGEVARLVEVVDAAAAAGDRQAIRDAAIVRLLFSAGPERKSAMRIRVEDIDQTSWVVRVARRCGRQSVSKIPPGTADALRRWLAVRGEAPGWLFVRTDRADGSVPLAGESVRRMLVEWCRAAGIRPIQPHGLRIVARREALALAEHQLSEVNDL